MLKKILIIFSAFAFLALPARADLDFYKNISGKILLQIQKNGEAWYVNPRNLKKYYLGRPSDALDLMRLFSLGITNKNLAKIPVGIIENLSLDTDKDGLSDNLEKSLGTDPTKKDTDNDGYIDKTEISSGYNPNGIGKNQTDLRLASAQSGKFLLQIENLGECWYVNPKDNKRYYLGSPIDAFNAMKKLGLGISNPDLEKIETGYFYNLPAKPATSTCANCQTNSAEIIYKAGEAIRKNNTEQVVSCFSQPLERVIRYTMNFLKSEGRFLWSEMLSGSTLLSSTENEKIYHNYVYYQGEKIEIKYHVQKQADGSWKITNI